MNYHYHMIGPALQTGIFEEKQRTIFDKEEETVKGRNKESVQVFAAILTREVLSPIWRQMTDAATRNVA